MKISIEQTAWGGLARQERLARLSDAAQAAAASGCDVLLTPELSLTGYAVGDALARGAEEKCGPLMAAVCEIAARHGIALIVGWVEQDHGTLYNTASCVGPTGELLAHHRKTVLPPGFEQDIFSPGDGPCLFTLAGVPSALLICYEAEIAEGPRAMADAGAHVVFVPTALYAQWASVAERMIPTRAFENSIAIAYANHAGAEGETTYFGGSSITDPTGEVLAWGGPNATRIEAEVNLATIPALRRRLPYGADAATLRQRLASRPADDK